ncbi:MAG: LPS-assembly protein LptD [Gammaproteobacteria bacterium]|nr:LPS-assembly protein LptD [Gammaproteobacteria bacterium]NNF60756.1 LPS-assembly protein LptD [Gammaproteobacteria bacterium]NNM20233.1 LPS-assembly protein LptD [Gammaproteobacteria bacterium]
MNHLFCQPAATRLMLASSLLACALLYNSAGAQSESVALRMSPRLDHELVHVSSELAVLSRREDSVFTGDVEVRYGDRRIIADQVSYNPDSGRLSASGNVRYADPRVELTGRQGEFETGDATGNFVSASFQLPQQDGRGEAQQIFTPDDNILEMRGVSYTTCPVDKDDWVLLAPQVRIDREKGVGVGRNVQMRFKGVPILYAPYLSFPVSDKRKTGLLAPDLGRSERSGTDISVPIYWNIRPNLDTTLTPRLLSKRGLQIETQFRYLWPRSSGQVDIEYLPGDDLAGRTRSKSTLRHQTRFGKGWNLDAQVQHVSDDQYFEDLGRSLGSASPTYLQRRGDLRYRGRNWRLLARAQGFQTLAEIAEDNRPYERVPQLLANASWNDVAGMNLGLRAELVNFQRRSGVTGIRLDLRPDLSMTMGGPGFSFTPRVEFRHTQYSLSNVEAGEPRAPSFSAPVVSLDSKAVFERPVGALGKLTQTLEPRVQFTHIPYRDQSDIPVFDSGEPDFNNVQLFRQNRFTGGDRLGDTDKISIGVTSRLLDFADGREYLTATFGQALFLSKRGVALPDAATPTANASNLIAEVGMDFSRKWNADVGYQWDPDSTQSSKAEVRVQFRPDEGRIVNLAYRFRREELEQSDLSFAWPVAKRWNLVGRWNYSLQDSTTLERFAGVEYETCCWVARVVSRNFVNNRDGEKDTALFTQIHFKGLASVGGRADLLLEDGILGYRTNN